MLFTEIVPLRYYAGNFRCVDHRYPCLNALVEVGGKLGLLPNAVSDEMRTFGSDLQIRDKELDAYLKSETRAEYQVAAKLSLVAGAIGTLIRIHPFINGNGRVSRLLANYLCYRYDLPMPFSDPYNRPSAFAYSLAGSSAMDGDFNPLFSYLFDALKGRLTPTV